MNITQCKRVYQRTSFMCRVTLSTGGGAAIETNSVDVSLGGVGLVSPRLVPTGQPVTLGFHLRNKAGEPVIDKVGGRVVHVRSDIDGHVLGVEFHEPLHRSRNPDLARKVESL
jgi:hypothetical protein